MVNVTIRLSPEEAATVHRLLGWRLAELHDMERRRRDAGLPGASWAEMDEAVGLVRLQIRIESERESLLQAEADSKF